MELGAAHVKGLYTVPNGSGTQFLDGVDEIEALALPCLKIYATADYLTDYPLQSAWSSTPTTITQLLQTTQFANALSRDFSTIFITAFTFANGSTNWWRVDPTNARLAAEYNEIKAAAVHLLTTYNNSGKTFCFQNWEGDWAFMDAFSANTAILRRYVEFYAAFLGVRQKAVQDARRETAHNNVTVLNAFEVNRVLDVTHSPHRARILTQIAPLLQPDVISYSAYDSTIADIGYSANQAAWEASCTTNFTRALRMIKRAFPGVPVSIGEYGFGENEIAAEQPGHDATAMVELVRDIAEAEGCKWCIYWEVFDNEVSIPYTYRGYWLVKPDGSLSEAGNVFDLSGA